MSELLDRNVELQVWNGVEKILGNDDSGHGLSHVKRVQTMSLWFASDVDEPVSLAVVSLAALLHDVDDYKIVGRKQSKKLSNAIEIMNNIGIDESTQRTVREIIASMGYGRALRGIRPTTLEGRIVSDADMCDAIGAGGIIRCLQYAVSSKGSGVVFNQNAWPIIDITADQYNKFGTTGHNDSFINHFFEKLLRLKDMMMTKPGYQEAVTRDKQMVAFLSGFFREENAPEWSGLLEKYLNQRRNYVSGQGLNSQK